MDGLQPVCFSLAVVTVDDVEPGSPKDLAAEISKIINFEGLEDHREILAYERRYLAVVDDRKRRAPVSHNQKTGASLISIPTAVTL